MENFIKEIEAWIEKHLSGDEHAEKKAEIVATVNAAKAQPATDPASVAPSEAAAAPQVAPAV